MNILIYIIPLVVFLVTAATMYLVSKQDDKENTDNIFLRNILPASLISILVFVIIKYHNNLFDNEPMMTGNYFD
jgi:positive regulator of sigma E activity